MTLDRPLRPPRRVEHDASGGRRLERILGYVPSSPDRISAILDDLGKCLASKHQVSHVAALVDATSRTPVRTSEGTTAIHVLWTAPGVRAEVFAGVDPHPIPELTPYKVHPGDTVSIPAQVPFAIGAGIVAFVFGSAPARITGTRSGSSIIQPPHHGLNLFARFNRRTICAAHDDLLLERWKISHPLDLTLNPRRWHYLVNLVEPVVLNWRGGSDVLQRTEARVVPAGRDRITIVPDGLGYVLIGSIPDLVEDVVRPLQRAGYERSAIASLGVPAHVLA